MKAIVLLCAFVSLALPRHEAFAQATASPQSQKAGHTKAPTRSAPVQTYASSGLDRTVEKLRPNFNGHDITVVYSALEERAKPTERSEFETTEQWHQRQANLRLPPIIGGMTAGSVWGFVVDVDSNYDADNQVLQVLIPWYSRGGAEFRDLTARLSGVVGRESTFRVMSAKRESTTSSYLGTPMLSVPLSP